MNWTLNVNLYAKKHIISKDLKKIILYNFLSKFYHCGIGKKTTKLNFNLNYLFASMGDIVAILRKTNQFQSLPLAFSFNIDFHSSNSFLMEFADHGLMGRNDFLGVFAGCASCPQVNCRRWPPTSSRRTPPATRPTPITTRRCARARCSRCPRTPIKEVPREWRKWNDQKGEERVHYIDAAVISQHGP